MRTIKFRAWRPELKRFRFFDLSTGFNVENADVFPSVDQYTGLKDKNGVEIYESDLLLDPSGYFEGLWLIRWMDAGFNGEEVESKDLYHACEFTDDFEVVGNIHQNPELIEKG